MTWQKFGLLCGMTAATLLPATANARRSGGHEDTDARCLALSMVMAMSADPAGQKLGPQGVSYFLGRIDGHGGRASLDDRLSAQFASFTPANVTPGASDCMKIMLKRVYEFRQVEGRMLQKYGKPGPTAPPTAAPHP